MQYIRSQLNFIDYGHFLCGYAKYSHFTHIGQGDLALKHQITCTTFTMSFHPKSSVKSTFINAHHPQVFPSPIIGISACIVVLSFTLVRDHLMGKLSRSEHGLPRSFQRSRAMPQRPVKPCYPSQISTLEPSRYLWEPKASPQSIGAEDWRELSYLDGMISRR
jgi:hypothetical protein